MLLLAALLSFGCPNLDVEFGPPKPLPGGCWQAQASYCCGSMLPAIRGGETLYVRSWDGKEPLLGKLVSTGKVLHQVVAENKRAVFTSGINNRHSDGWTPKAEIQYVVRYVVRPGYNNTTVQIR